MEQSWRTHPDDGPTRVIIDESYREDGEVRNRSSWDDPESSQFNYEISKVTSLNVNSGGELGDSSLHELDSPAPPSILPGNDNRY